MMSLTPSTVPSEPPIKLVEPYFSPVSLDYIKDVVLRGHLHSDGPFAERCESLLREALPCAMLFLTSSCTSALEFSAQLLEIGHGDEVLLPSFAPCAKMG